MSYISKTKYFFQITLLEDLNSSVLQAYMYSCPMTGKHWSPEYVSIMSEDSVVPSNILTVFLPENPPALQPYCVCSGIYDDTYDPHRLMEWMEMYRMFGIDELHVYNHTILQKGLHILQHYVNLGFVKIHRIPAYPSPNQFTLELLRPIATNDCLYRNLFRCEYVAMLSSDALLTPRYDTSIRDMVTSVNLDCVNGEFYPRSYVFSTAYFFLDFPPIIEQPEFIISTRYLTRVNSSSYEDAKSSILSPLACVYLKKFICDEPRNKYNRSSWNVSVSADIGNTHYYKNCQKDQAKEIVDECAESMSRHYIDNTMLKHSDAISTRVAEASWRFNLIDITDDGLFMKKDFTEYDQYQMFDSSVDDPMKPGNDIRVVANLTDVQIQVLKTGLSTKELQHVENIKELQDAIKHINMSSTLGYSTSNNTDEMSEERRLNSTTAGGNHVIINFTQTSREKVSISSAKSSQNRQLGNNIRTPENVSTNSSNFDKKHNGESN